jgi:sRNA-binding carbon storage regulator CsrA
VLTEVISNGFSARSKSVLHSDKIKDFRYLIDQDLKKLKKKFITLQFEIRESLSKRVPPQKIVAHVLSDYEDICENHDRKQTSLFSDADQEMLNSAISVDQVFQVLRKYWSFLKCEIIYSIVDHCGDESDQTKVKDYQVQLQIFFNKRKVSEVPEELMSSSSINEMRDKMLIKLDMENPPWTAITDLEFRVCEILGIMPSVLLIIGIQEGCVEITLSIPKHVSQQIFRKPLTKEQQKQFKAASILKLSCGHVHLTFEVSHRLKLFFSL